MSDLLFDRATGKWTGTDREKQHYETVVRNIDTDKLTKSAINKRSIIKKNPYGQTVYLLPQPDRVDIVDVIKQVETVDVTDTPVLVTVNELTPLMKDGVQVTSRRSRVTESTEESDSPVMVRDTQGKVVQKVNDDNKPLYFKMVPYGKPIPVRVSRPTEVHKEKNGEKLYYREEEVTEETRTPVEPLEVVEDDPGYVPGLDPQLETIEEIEVLWFNYSPREFNINDVIKFKEQTLLEGTFGTSSVLFEVIQHLFQGTVGKDVTIGYDYIDIKPNGTITTPPILLPEESKYITVVPDVSKGKGLKVTLIHNDEEFETNSFFEHTFDEDLKNVKIKLTNTGSVDMSIESIGIIL